MFSRFLSTLAITAALGAAPAAAHGTTAGDLPLIPGTVQLRHRSPSEIVALFAREQWRPESTPRGARAGSPDALLPEGIDGLIRSGEHEVTLVGFEPRFAPLAGCLEVVDAPVEKTGDHVRVTLTLRRASGRDLRLQVARLPGAHTVEARGQQLTLEGSPAWLHQALRRVIRAELGLHAPHLPPTP